MPRQRIACKIVPMPHAIMVSATTAVTSTSVCTQGKRCTVRVEVAPRTAEETADQDNVVITDKDEVLSVRPGAADDSGYEGSRKMSANREPQRTQADAWQQDFRRCSIKKQFSEGSVVVPPAQDRCLELDIQWSDRATLDNFGSGMRADLRRTSRAPTRHAN
jgi:hypothetical protein